MILYNVTTVVSLTPLRLLPGCSFYARCKRLKADMHCSTRESSGKVCRRLEFAQEQIWQVWSVRIPSSLIDGSIDGRFLRPGLLGLFRGWDLQSTLRFLWHTRCRIKVSGGLDLMIAVTYNVQARWDVASALCLHTIDSSLLCHLTVIRPFQRMAVHVPRTGVSSPVRERSACLSDDLDGRQRLSMLIAGV